MIVTITFTYGHIVIPTQDLVTRNHVKPFHAFNQSSTTFALLLRRKQKKKTAKCMSLRVFRQYLGGSLLTQNY